MFNSFSWKDWSSVIFSGIITGLAYYTEIYGLFAWVSFIPLLHIISKFKPDSKPFIIGYIFGISYNLVAFYWIALNSGTSFFIALCSLIAAISYLSVFWGLLTTFIYQIKNYVFRLIIFPFAVVLMEWLRSLGPLGFPWSNLALTQINLLPLVQIMDITGSYGVSALVLIINTVLYYFLINLNKSSLFLLCLSFLSLLLLWNVGTKKIDNYNKYSKTFEVAVIQPNINPNSKWDSINKEIIKSKLDSLYEMALNLKPDLILFPETAYPTYLRFDQTIRNYLQKKVSLTGISTLVGTVDRKKSKEQKNNYFNSSFYFTKNKDIQIYNKTHLVPFAEYVPFSDIIPIFKRLNFGQGNFEKGKEISIFDLNGLKFSNIICYESSIPGIINQIVRNGVNFLTIQTNDGWLGNSIGPIQHYNIAKIRAIENRIPVVRSGNNGVSGMILPNGISINEKSFGVTSVFRVSVPIVKPGTFFSQNGNIFVILCLALTIIILLWSLKKSSY